MKGRELVSFV